MKIYTYHQFNESRKDPPEEYVKTLLLKLKKNLEDLFEDVGTEDVSVPGGEDPVVGEEENKQKSDIQSAKKRSRDKNKGEMSLVSQGARLESCEFSNSSALYDSLMLKFSTPNGWYSLYLTIPLEDVVDIINDNEGNDSDISDIKECSVKLKGYSSDDRLLGQIGPKNVKISEVGEDLLINMKIELDAEFGDEETLEFET
jgi:hypothetical protein